MTTKSPSRNYNVLSNTFLEIVDVHTPPKTKIVRHLDALFVGKQLGKAHYIRTRLKNKIHKNPSKENKITHKNQTNFCVSLRRKSINNCFKNHTEKGLPTSNSFREFIKPFLTKKDLIRNNDITLIQK